MQREPPETVYPNDFGTDHVMETVYLSDSGTNHIMETVHLNGSGANNVMGVSGAGDAERAESCLGRLRQREGHALPPNTLYFPNP